MGIIEDKIKDLKEREAKILKMGGDKGVAKQKEKGKLTARERLDLFFDPGTFREPCQGRPHKKPGLDHQHICKILNMNSAANSATRKIL